MTRSPLLCLGFALCLLAGGTAIASPLPAPDATPRAVIEAFDQQLLDVMRQAGSLGYDGRYQALAPVIQRSFNIPLMTRILVGLPWRGWTDEQRATITAAFGRFVTATYARRFDGYSGEEFVIDGEQDAPAGDIVIATHITRKNDPPVHLNYLLRDPPDGPAQIVDIFLTGTISELATRRSEFSDVLNRQGYQGLLTALTTKSEQPAPP